MTGSEFADRRWSRRNLQALLAGVAAAAAALLVGVVLLVESAVRPGGSGTEHAPAAGSTRGGALAAADDHPQSTLTARDALAARPMQSVPETAAGPGPVSTRDPGPAMRLPAARRVGPAQVPAGFAATPAGALGQLAAIDQTALQSGSLIGVRTVITSWALPGGPTGRSWSAVPAMAALLDAAGLSGGGSPQLALVATPLMGLIKGTVGRGFVVPCVDFELDVTLDQTSRVAVADCQRMQWTGRRWMVAAGAEPAPAPSVWPDTDTALAAGWRDLSHA